MEPAETLARLRRDLAAFVPPARLELDDFGNVLFYVQRELYHLDADAMNDRLHAWVAREAAREVRDVAAFVSFRHARPDTPDRGELDVQSLWRGLEPTLRLDVTPAPDEATLARFVALVPRFLALVHAEGRPEGWRNVHDGAAE